MNLRLDDRAIKDILTTFDTRRMGELFGTNSLEGMHGLLVQIFQSSAWMSPEPRVFKERNEFILKLNDHVIDSDDHRRIFRAMAEAPNAHGVATYLHMLRRKENVFLSDHSALFTIDDLTALVKDRGAKLTPAIHFLTRAVSAGHGDGKPELFRAMVRAFDPEFKLSSRYELALSNIVKRWGVKALGLAENDATVDKWVKQFFHSEDPKTQRVATAILAGQMHRRHLSLYDLCKVAHGPVAKKRLVQSFDVDPEFFGFKAIKSSHDQEKANYGLSL